MNNILVEKVWDYSKHAEFYKYRPNYNSKVIDILCEYIEISKEKNKIADIGAGTGNLSLLLLDKGLDVTAVEPNDNMRQIGIERTKLYSNICWIKANGTSTTLNKDTFDWVTFGSSFNVLDRDNALKETCRILKREGYFSCLWNHRNLNDPIQNIAENIIIDFIPNYTRGVRREDQRPILEKYEKLFSNIFYIEQDFDINRTIDEYINAWKSVKNKYWDLDTKEGIKLFNKITDKMQKELPQNFIIKYTTVAWTTQKR